jgi:hypothetical protein
MAGSKKQFGQYLYVDRIAVSERCAGLWRRPRAL